jgi:hypothetical protein
VCSLVWSACVSQPGGQRIGEKKGLIFLKKRSKKLLILEMPAALSGASTNKSFLVLFFKKEHLSSFFRGATCKPQSP